MRLRADRNGFGLIHHIYTDIFEYLGVSMAREISFKLFMYQVIKS